MRKPHIDQADAVQEDADSLFTRASLLSKMQNWQNDREWQEFFSKYWKLIYHFALRSGLSDADAQDIVQDVLLAVSKAMPGFRYDRSKGRFRSWLLTVVRTRLANHWERHGRARRLEAAIESGLSPQEDASSDLEKRWDTEWSSHVISGAMERVRRRAKGRHFLFFDMVERQGIPLGSAAAAAGLLVAHGYVIRHRLRGMLREEVKRMEND